MPFKINPTLLLCENPQVYCAVPFFLFLTDAICESDRGNVIVRTVLICSHINSLLNLVKAFVLHSRNSHRMYHIKDLTYSNQKLLVEMAKRLLHGKDRLQYLASEYPGHADSMYIAGKQVSFHTARKGSENHDVYGRAIGH